MDSSVSELESGSFVSPSKARKKRIRELRMKHEARKHHPPRRYETTSMLEKEEPRESESKDSSGIEEEISQGETLDQNISSIDDLSSQSNPDSGPHLVRFVSPRKAKRKHSDFKKERNKRRHRKGQNHSSSGGNRKAASAPALCEYEGKERKMRKFISEKKSPRSTRHLASKQKPRHSEEGDEFGMIQEKQELGLNLALGPSIEDVEGQFFIDDDAKSLREDQLGNIERGGESLALLLQGILAGFSVAGLFDAIPSRQPAAFILQYAHRANETRRFYFIATTLCLMSRICVVLSSRGREGDVGQAPRMGKSGPNAASPYAMMFGDAGIICTSVLNLWSRNVLVLIFYGLALIVSLPAAVIDVHLLPLSQGMGEDDVESAMTTLDDELEGDRGPDIARWRALSIVRSLCSLAAWALVMRGHYRAVQERREKLDALWRQG